MPYSSPYTNPYQNHNGYTFEGFRTFSVVSAYRDKDIVLPQRQTSNSAGYDIEAAEDVTIPPLTTVLVPTGIKAFMTSNEYLMIALRSSLAVKRNLSLANGVGIIDADYCNADNEGHIMIPLHNNNPKLPVSINKHERVAQGIFMHYLITDDDKVTGKERIGGFGSTGK